MTKKKKALGLAILTLAFLFGSIFSAIVAFDDIKNYSSPYWFLSLNIIIGGVIGLLIWKKIKPLFYKVAKEKDKITNVSTFVVIAAIGYSLFIFNFLNTRFSKLDGCSSYRILGKVYQEGGAYRGPTLFTLIVNIDGVNKYFHCDRDYWSYKKRGDIIKLCRYNSNLGFEYRTLIK